ncbi:S41 family peptidase [Clostridium felsineum]|uniref:S41 family peptidase n=1 Tax=Clostridium felsineum TaxID=36839 RepID=UPI00098BD06A|nr:S41 family peptidase [Clostridium felsineum]URZ02117.1 Carboxy-terminal processing protease CtpA [Clostridium felsineum]
MDNKKKKWIAIVVAILVVTNAASLFLGGRFLVFQGNNKVVVDKDTYNKFSKIFSVRDQLYKYYDGKISDDVLLDGALKGMTASLKDPYTVYMDKSETKSFNSELQGEQYVGLGMEVQAKDNKVIVATVFDNSPAEKAGMKSGDVILKVNGNDVVTTDLNKTVSMIKGKEGTDVTLTLYRSTKGNFDITAKRAKVAIDTVTGEMLNDKIACIQISMFDENTGNNFNKKIDELKSQGMKGLILDLRSNPGGLLNSCIQVTSNFVEKDKVIVSTIDKYNSKEEYKSKGGNYIGLPLVVLVDGNTASASEIFSGAIRDYKLGTLIGVKTFGKGVVQAPFDLNDNTQLKITISKYYTPNGENIQHKGIKPDIEVKYPDTLKDKPYDRNVDPQFQKALEQIQTKIK